MTDRLLATTVASGTVGVVLMLAFEGLVARIAGLLALAVFMVCGLFLIAEPQFLAQEDEDEAHR